MGAGSRGAGADWRNLHVEHLRILAGARAVSDSGRRGQREAWTKPRFVAGAMVHDAGPAVRRDDVDVTVDGACQMVAVSPGVQPAVFGDGVDDAALAAYDRDEQVRGATPPGGRSVAVGHELHRDAAQAAARLTRVPTER